jgi:hypothetical protein
MGGRVAWLLAMTVLMGGDPALLLRSPQDDE